MCASGEGVRRCGDVVTCAGGALGGLCASGEGVRRRVEVTEGEVLRQISELYSERECCIVLSPSCDGLLLWHLREGWREGGGGRKGGREGGRG